MLRRTLAFKRVLVAVDFEPASLRAVEAALELANKFDAVVTIVHVEEFPAAAYGSFAEGIEWPTEALMKAARARLDVVIEEAKAKYAHVDGTLVGGRAAEAILQVAKIWDADVIVMGTHGRADPARSCVGSVAERVVRTSEVPVLTVSDAEPARPAATKENEAPVTAR